jgi:multiple sugar transport system substrate-binding protein
MKKTFLGLLFVLLIATFAFAAPVTVEFWHAMGGGHGEALAEIVKLFNQQNPEMQINAVYIGNYNALQQKLLASVQSNTLPGLSQAYSNWTAKLLLSDIVQDLTPMLNDPETGFTKAEWEDIWEPFRKMCTWGDKVYAIPFNKSIYVFYYNTDAFDAEGLTAPKTMEELYKLCRTLTVDENNDGTIDKYGFAYRTTVDHFSVFLYAFGGEIVHENADGTYNVVINSQEAKKTLTFMKRLKDENLALVQGGYLDAPFGEGSVLSFIETIASKPYVESGSKGKHDWDWTAVPYDAKLNPPFAGTDVIMFNTIPEEQKKVAWEFLKFLSSSKVTTFWSLKTGYVPVRKSSIETSEWKIYVKMDEKAATPVKFIDQGYSDPKPATWNEIRNTITSMLNNVLFDKWTIDEGLQWAEKEILNYLAQ